jgi:hypothetical protein
VFYRVQCACARRSNQAQGYLLTTTQPRNYQARGYQRSEPTRFRYTGKAREQARNFRHQREHGCGEEDPDGPGLVRVDDHLETQPDTQKLKELGEDRHGVQAGPEGEPGGCERVKRHKNGRPAEYKQDIEEHDALEDLEDEADEAEVGDDGQHGYQPYRLSDPQWLPAIGLLDEIHYIDAYQATQRVVQQDQILAEQLAQVDENYRQDSLGSKQAQRHVDGASCLPVEHLYGHKQDNQPQEPVRYACHDRPGTLYHVVGCGQRQRRVTKKRDQAFERPADHLQETVQKINKELANSIGNKIHRSPALSVRSSARRLTFSTRDSVTKTPGEGMGTEPLCSGR